MAVERLSQASILTLNKYSTMMAGSVPGGDFELITTQVLTGTVTSVTFDTSTLAALGYTHLQIRAVVRDNRGSAGSNCWLRFNNAAALYSGHQVYGTGSGVSGGNATNGSQIYISDIAGGTATANAFSPLLIDISDFASTTKNKTMRALGGTNSGYNWMSASSGAWYSTNAVTSITILDTLANFVADSRFSLYGYRG